jgi:hypothetical protein
MKKVTLLSGCIFSLVGLLVSCADDSPERAAGLPVKEIYFNFETGQKFGEKKFTYDSRGNVIREYFTDLSGQYDKEIRYEYDADGNLLKKMQREPQVDETYFINVYTYENGLKISEAMQRGESLTGYKTDYFYSGSTLDSARLYFYLSGENAYRYNTTVRYEHDASNRVIRAYDMYGSGNTLYRYEGNRLKETCNLVPGTLRDLEDCIENTYDRNGNLIRIATKAEWGNRVQEEFFYTQNVLSNRKVYFYPAYEPGNTVDVTLVKYQY